MNTIGKEVGAWSAEIRFPFNLASTSINVLRYTFVITMRGNSHEN